MIKTDFSLKLKESVCENPRRYGFKQRNHTSKYYLIADLMMRWVEGEFYCQSLGSHLPVAKNPDDLSFLRST